MESKTKKTFEDFDDVVLNKIEEFTKQIKEMNIDLNKEKDEKKLDRFLKICKDMIKIKDLILGPSEKTPKKRGPKPKTQEVEDNQSSASVEERVMNT